MKVGASHSMTPQGVLALTSAKFSCGSCGFFPPLFIKASWEDFSFAIWAGKAQKNETFSFYFSDANLCFRRDGGGKSITDHLFPFPLTEENLSFSYTLSDIEKKTQLWVFFSSTAHIEPVDTLWGLSRKRSGGVSHVTHLSRLSWVSRVG